jgi:tripartite-type tricarboxylate transporter receptor subunit TctC
MVALSSAVNATLFDNLPFVFLRDIAPVATVCRNILVMEVHPSVPVATGLELIAYGKANPNKLNMGSPGSGTGPRMAGELFKLMTGVRAIHVPYRGSAPILNDLLSGQVQLAFDGIASSIGHIRAGRLRALGVGNATRVEALPDVPAVAEFVPGYEAGGTQGVGVPRKTPVEIIEKLNREINAGLADPTMRARITDLGNTPLALSPAEYGKLLAEETEKWGKVVKFAGIKPEYLQSLTLERSAGFNGIAGTRETGHVWGSGSSVVRWCDSTEELAMNLVALASQHKSISSLEVLGG